MYVELQSAARRGRPDETDESGSYEPARGISTTKSTGLPTNSLSAKPLSTISRRRGATTQERWRVEVGFNRLRGLSGDRHHRCRQLILLRLQQSQAGWY